MRALLVALVGLAAGCGGESDPAEAAVVEPWGLPASGDSAVGLSDCDTVIIVALDKVLRSELFGVGDARPSADATPCMDSIAIGAQRAMDAVTTSTAGNAAMASLLTGRHITEHGIVSLRDVGFQTLPDSEETLAEGFAAAGWSTIFSSGSPLHAQGFSGFSQGFEHYEAPRLSEPSRGAPSVANGALLPLKNALAEDRKVFALLSFDDLTARALRPPSAEIAAPFVSAWLGPLAQDRADIESALRTLDADPEQGIDDLTKLLARARGSRASIAWNMALRAAHLSVIDAAVGEVLATLEAAGRGERALVVVTGLRGTLPPGFRHEAGALFTSDAINVPLAVRWPGGAQRSEPIDGTLSLLDVAPALAAVGDFELRPTAFRCSQLGTGTHEPGAPGPAFVSDSQRKLLAAISGELQAERYIDGQVVTFDRSGEQVRGEASVAAVSLGTGLAEFVAAATAIELYLSVGAKSDYPGLSCAWESAPGAATFVQSEGTNSTLRPAVRGKYMVENSSGALRLTERGTAVRLLFSSTDQAGIGPDLLWIGSRAGSALPLMYTPMEDGEASASESDDKPQARLRIARSDGLWWTLSVEPPADAETGASTEVLVSVWPPRDPVDELEVSAGGGVTRHAVPGRADLVRIEGTAPFTCRIKKLAKEDFSVACLTPDGFLMPTEMEFHGMRFADPTAFQCVLAHRQGQASATLPSLDAELYLDVASLFDEGALPDMNAERASLLDLPTAHIDVERRWIGPPPMEFTPPSVSDLLELVRLVPGE